MTRRDDASNLLPVVERLVEHRYGSAVDEVARLRAAHPDDDVDALADRLIRRYTKDLAIGGAVTGGAAAAPVAGMAVAAASAGADAAFSVGRLGEMIMAIGLLYGHDSTTAEQRRAAVLTVMGLADGAAVGVSGLAARAGARGGVRLLRRLPAAAPAAAGAGVTRRTIAKLAAGRGPWSLAALVPYGIGAGVGAAGNALLARAVGRGAKEYFGGGHLLTNHGEVQVEVEVVEVDGVEVEIVVEQGTVASVHEDDDPDVVDAVVVEPDGGASRRGRRPQR